MRRFCLVIGMVLMLSAVGLAAAQKTVTFMEVGDAAKMKAFEEYYPIWRQLHPEIAVEYSPLAYSESFTKIKTMFAAGIPYDVSPMYSPGYDTMFVEANALLAMDDLIKRDGITEDDFLPGIFNSWDQFHNGERIALPYGFSGRVLWYNPELFDTAGLAYPSTSWTDTSWTWADFVSVGKKLTRDINGDGINDVWGLAGLPNFFGNLAPFMWGQEIFNADFSEFILNQAAGAATIQRIADLALVERITPVPFTTQAPFASGMSAMMIEGAWAMGQARSWDVKWNWAVMPLADRRVTEITLDKLYVAKSSNQDAAWEWAKFLATNTQAQILYAGQGNGKIPTQKQAAYEWVTGELAKLYPGLNTEVLLNALPYNVGERLGSTMPNWTRILPLLTNAYNRIFTGQASANQVMNEIKPSIDAILREMK